MEQLVKVLQLKQHRSLSQQDMRDRCSMGEARIVQMTPLQMAALHQEKFTSLAGASIRMGCSYDCY